LVAGVKVRQGVLTGLPSRKLEAQEATISRQQKQIEALTSGLEKMNARLATDESVRLADFRRASQHRK
jgi:uncharacterized coiled-coil protein SlyX